MTDSDSDCSTLTDLSSELSSAPSSPRLLLSPKSYPTPDSSQAQSTYSSSSELESRKRRRKAHEAPPTKKRKVTGDVVKERKIEHLNLRVDSSRSEQEQSAQLETLLKVLRKKKKIVVVAGAGISTSAGVPDFRSSNGLFNTLRSDSKLKASGKQLFDASVYQRDDSTSNFHEMVRMMSSVVNGAKATAFHHMLATLADEGRLLRLYTQNVDGLDAGLEPLRTEIPLPKKGPWPRTVQLHGSLKKMVCVKCGELRNFDPELFDGPKPPSCISCIDLDKIRTEEAGKRSHGIGKLRPRMVLYNEHNPEADAIGSVTESDLRARPDAIIVVGTSMEIPGVQRMVRELCAVTGDRKDGKCIWINRSPPPTGPKYENLWDLVVAGDCDRVAELADMRQWYEEPREGVRVTDSDAERAKAKETELKVVVKLPVTKLASASSLPTPLPSPKLEAAVKKTGLKLNFKPLKDQKLKDQKTLTTKLLESKSSHGPVKPKKSKAPKSKLAHTTTMVKINTTFKVSKPKDLSMKMSHSDQPNPFNPILLKSARANSSGSPIYDTSLVKRPKIEVKVEEPTPTTGRLKQMSEERVSPTGPIPNCMAHILN